MKLTKQMEMPLINRIITNKDKLLTVVMVLPVVGVDKTIIMDLFKIATEPVWSVTVTAEWEPFQLLAF
mgnify:CR=1 FL=1